MKRLFLLSALVISSTVHSFSLTPSRNKFGTDKVVVNVAGNSCSNNNLSPSSILEIMEDAIGRTWNAVSTANLELQMGSIISGVDVSADASTYISAQKADGNTILVGCNSNLFTSSSTLAVGNIYNINGAITGIVLINDELIDGENRVATLDRTDLESVLAHELGHALGIGHSSDRTALMYYAIGGKVQEHLAQDDWDALTYLYPHDAPGACGSVTLVPPGNGNDRSRPFISLFVTAFLMTIMLSRIRTVKTDF